MARPSTDGLRIPAEWEAHDCVWVAWPYREEDWPGCLDAAREESAGLCRAISGGETVCVLVRDEASERDARRRLGGLDARFVRAVYADLWLRDTAPVFALTGTGLAALSFEFNGWGGRYLFEEDLSVAPAVTEHASADPRRIALVSEGGAFEHDGSGTVLVTAESVVNDNRNPRTGRDDVEALLRRECGVRAVVWLERGLAGDHTDGHVDTLARFVAPGRVVCMQADDEGDPNFAVLEEIRETLAAATDADGRRLEVTCIPSPGRIDDAAGDPLPASYVNFYIANSTVVVPTYGSEHDQAAVRALAQCFPDRRVVGSSARSLLTGGGAFHCMTQQQPCVAALGESE